MPNRFPSVFRSTPPKTQIHKLVILGGGSDIAASFVSAIAPRGLSTLVLAGREHGSLEPSAAHLKLTHPDVKVETWRFDAIESDSHQGVLYEIDATHGPIDTFMVAFGELGAPFSLDGDPGAAARLGQVNFCGAVSASLAAINVLRGRRSARLVVITSIAAVRPRVGNLVYGASKAGLDAFCRELIAPARRLGVKVCLVRPGFVHTRMTEGLQTAPLATTPDQVGRDIVEGLDKGRKIIHSPSALGPVGLVLRNLPQPIWRVVSNR